LTEDDERRLMDEVQKLTDRTVAEIDKLVHGKEAEILAV
jgi:ribosome recycling factor